MLAGQLAYKISIAENFLFVNDLIENFTLFCEALFLEVFTHDYFR